MNFQLILRNTLSVALGMVIGGFANGKILEVFGTTMIKDMEKLKEMIGSFQPKDFAVPFLAHAIGTLIATFIITILVKNGMNKNFTSMDNKKALSLLAGSLFFLGGLSMVFMLPAPMWFNILDLVVAYFPMALLGYFLGRNINIGF